jgi:tricorn protease
MAVPSPLLFLAFPLLAWTAATSGAPESHAGADASTELSAPADGVDTTDTRLLAQPASSAERLAFVYAGDLWSARLDGQDVRRLTSHPGSEVRPRFSPDGELVAFTGEYDGNMDVYVVPATGGVPRRLTWHPGADVVQDWTPDGSEVLFTSDRAVHTNRFRQLFTVPLEGGHPTALPIPTAYKASYSPDGSRIAYTPLREPFRQWKNYRGGTATRIWVLNLADLSVEQVPQPDGRCNDTDPMWLDGELHFLSDRDGEFNLYAWSPGGAPRRLTDHADFPVLAASAGAGRIVYEQAGWLHLYLPGSGARRLQVGVAADLVETRPRWVDAKDHVRSGGISPAGKRAVAEMRGEIFTVPAEKGDARNLTNTPGVHERAPAWSPDGRWIAYVSDEGGEYRLHVTPQDGRGEVRNFELGGAGFYEDLAWSPDSKRISYTDNSWALFVLEVESGAVTEVGREPLYGPIRTMHHAWSPDSRWLAYTLNTPMYFKQVHLYDVEADESHVVTDGLSDVSEPVFDASGDYLWFAASTDAGPGLTWFAMSNADVRVSNALYLAVLSSGDENPLARESDEVEIAEEEEDSEESDEEDGESEEGDDPEGEEGAGADEEEDDGEESEEEEVRTEIDLQGLAQRIVALPLPAAYFRDLHPGKAGELYYIRAEDGSAFGSAPGSLARFDLESREETTLLEGVGGFALSADAGHLLLSVGENLHIAPAGAPVDISKGRLALDRVRIKIDPRAEWPQIFDEAWRINRDYFYDPDMHGADWRLMRAKYAEFLPHLAVRSDLNRVIQWMCSELSVGHHNVGGGDTLVRADSVPGGLLGADYEIADGRYRFAKVFGGLNWNPRLRAPLTEPGVGVEAGEYLLAVDGVDLAPPENLYSRFENTAGRIVELTVGSNADGTDSRTVEVVPIGNESSLRNRDWVEGNIAKVTEATDGRVAYVYVLPPGRPRRDHRRRAAQRRRVGR